MIDCKQHAQGDQHDRSPNRTDETRVNVHGRTSGPGKESLALFGAIRTYSRYPPSRINAIGQYRSSWYNRTTSRLFNRKITPTTIRITGVIGNPLPCDRNG